MGRCVVGHHVVGVASTGLLLRKRVRYTHPEVWQAVKGDRERGRAMEKSEANQNISLCFDITLAWHIMAAGAP